ncbi:class I SAM-dependent methyltransferase [Microtetraspora malaysiensis]|uniref:class I SAM-dependent methyltransferase n=1 Tax=Microtetraspora malaysiensis TaxID=161358 RepID=UPI0008342486|nr:class I SAM-dependent methyltransferase [Microtetraspora malaysiensis]
MTESPEFAPEIMDYYLRGRENERLRSGRGRLELWRTRDVLRRVLPPAPARVLDVGGAGGVHAEWLAADGYRVEVVDPVPAHVDQAARLPGVVARVGDARALEDAGGSADAVLLLGPLYHLSDRADRVRALAEARRVVRPGGVVAAATISRWAAVHDMIRSGRYAEESVRPVVDDSARHGLLRGNERIGFTTAYFHDPDEILGEFADAGLPEARRYALEGVFSLYADINEWLDDPERRGMLLDVARRSEGEPTLLGVAGHMLTVAHA